MTAFLVSDAISSAPIGDKHAGQLVARNKVVDDNNVEIGSRLGTRAYGDGLARLAYTGTTGVNAVAITAAEVLLHNCGVSRCYVRSGTGTPTADVNDIPIEPGEKFHMRITSGDKIAAIRATGDTDGNLNIIPVS